MATHQSLKRRASVVSLVQPTANKRPALNSTHASRLRDTDITECNASPLLRLLRVAELRDMVVANMHVRDLASLRRTSREMSLLTLDINSRLRSFVPCPAELRNLQAETGALLTGPFALNLIEGLNENTSVLEVYVNVAHTEKWHDYLTRQNFEGQGGDSERIGKLIQSKGISEVCHLSRNNTLLP